MYVSSWYRRAAIKIICLNMQGVTHLHTVVVSPCVAATWARHTPCVHTLGKYVGQIAGIQDHETHVDHICVRST